MAVAGSSTCHSVTSSNAHDARDLTQATLLSLAVTDLTLLSQRPTTQQTRSRPAEHDHEQIRSDIVQIQRANPVSGEVQREQLHGLQRGHGRQVNLADHQLHKHRGTRACPTYQSRNQLRRASSEAPDAE